MGELTKNGESRLALPDDLALYERAQSMQALQEVPVLQRADNPHEYLFFALFDGTGQDVSNPEQPPTNIGVLKQQIDLLRDNPDLRIGSKYVEGIGTQDNLATRYADAWIPYTWDDKIEEAYKALAEQTRKWQQQDPHAQVRIAGVGYSRGAVLATGLAQLVDKYGIADPENLTFARDAQGNITVESPRPPLMAPGQVAQAMGLYDPVATNMPENFDARRASSVISATALAARHEQRTAFPHQTILEPGLSHDRRFANLLVPGGHSNVGGGNGAPGLEVGAFNVMADYLNGLRDKPLFQYRPLPDDPAAYTVYQARGPTAVPGMDKDGLRDLRTDLANCKIVDPCRDGAPINQALAGQFEVQRLQPAAPVPSQYGGAQMAVPDPGDQARSVVNLQAGLIQLGYHRSISQPLQVNGSFDDATRQAVTAFQAKHDLPITNSFDQATQQALQQALLTQQQATEQRQAEDKTREKDDAEKEQSRSEALLPYSDPTSPQHARRADLAQRAQAAGANLTEEQLTLGVAQMQARHIQPGWEGGVAVRDGILYVQQFMPPEQFVLDTRQPAPPVQETLQQAANQQREHAEELARMEAMPKIHGPTLGSGGPGGMPSMQG